MLDDLEDFLRDVGLDELADTVDAIDDGLEAIFGDDD